MGMAMDYYVRLSREELDRLPFTHLYTGGADDLEADGVCMVALAGEIGITEWCAYYGSATLSVGWDWIRAANGCLVMANPLAIRTNVMLVNERCEDLGRRHTLAHLALSMDRMAWERVVAGILADGDRQASP